MCQIPKLYCLPKLDQSGKSIRLTVAALGAPTYNLAKSLTKKLKELPVSEWVVDDKLSRLHKIELIPE